MGIKLVSKITHSKQIPIDFESGCMYIFSWQICNERVLCCDSTSISFNLIFLSAKVWKEIVWCRLIHIYLTTFLVILFDACRAYNVGWGVYPKFNYHIVQRNLKKYDFIDFVGLKRSSWRIVSNCLFVISAFCN